MTELSLSKTVQIKNIVVSPEANYVRQYKPLSENVNVVWQQTTKDDKKNRESYATFFADAKEKIELELQRFEKNTVSQRIRKNRIDEINSIPRYRKPTVTEVRF